MHRSLSVCLVVLMCSLCTCMSHGDAYNRIDGNDIQRPLQEIPREHEIVPPESVKTYYHSPYGEGEDHFARFKHFPIRDGHNGYYRCGAAPFNSTGAMFVSIAIVWAIYCLIVCPT